MVGNKKIEKGLSVYTGVKAIKQSNPNIKTSPGCIQKDYTH